MKDESDFEVPEFLKESYRQQERERIIKIIESNRHINSDQSFFLVQAIKGEQK